MELALYLLPLLTALWWPFCRILALLSAAPIVGDVLVPLPLRVLLSLVLAFLMLPVVAAQSTPEPFSLAGVAATVEQAAIGGVLGLAMHFSMSVLSVLGYLVSSQIGFSMAQMNDPVNGTSSDVVSSLLSILSIFVFFSIDGHLVLTGVMGASFQAWPVGGGIGPLLLHTVALKVAWIFAAAMLLAKAGVDVTLFERLDRVGGRSSTITAPTSNGTFRFDVGPTFFLYPRVLADIFAACSRRLEDEVDLIRLDPQYHLKFEAGGELQATGDMERLAAEVAKLSPADAAALPRFMADNRRKLAAFRPVLESAFNGIRDLVRPDMLRSLPLMRPHRTVDSDLGTYFRDERVRLAFSFQSKYLGMSPFRCPSLFTILSFMEYEYGVYHPRGGCGAVMSAMARVARDLGVKIKLAEPIERILFEGRRAVGVRSNGVEQRFDALVVNADFAQTMTNLVPDSIRRRWTDRRIAAKKFSCSTFMMYLGLEGDFPGLAHHTIYLAKDYRRNLAEIEAGEAPGEPSFYVQNACVTDPALAPPGHSTLYVLVPVGHRVGEASIGRPSRRATGR